MHRILETLLLVLVGSTLGYGEAPTIQLRLTDVGINFFSQVAIQTIKRTMSSVKLPPVKLGTKMLQVSVTNTTMDFVVSDLELKPVPPYGVIFKSINGSLEMHSDFTAAINFFLTKVIIPGKVVVSASDFAITLETAILTADGHPVLEMTNCHTNVDRIIVDVSVEQYLLDKLLENLKGFFSDYFQKVINRNLCYIMKSAVINGTNFFLAQIPHHMQLIEGLYVNYAFQDFKVTENYLQADAVFDITLGTPSQDSSNTSDVDLRFFSVPCNMPNDSMLYIWLSDEIPNLLLATAFENGYLNITLTNTSCFEEVTGFLRTTCPFYELCVGNIFPALAKKYPNQYAVIRYYPVSEPVYATTSRGITVGSHTQFEVFIPGHEQEDDAFATFTTDTRYIVVPELEGRRLSWKLLGASVSIVELGTKMGSISSLIFNGLVGILKIISSLAGATFLKFGIDIPIIDNFTLTNTNAIDLLPGVMLINLDFAQI